MFILGWDIPMLEVIVYTWIIQVVVFVVVIVIQVILLMKTKKYYDKVKSKSINDSSPATTAR